MSDIFSKQCIFLIGATKRINFPYTDYPEIAFLGRSNVGKSSLINALLNKKRLARISSTPGRTQQINFFLLAKAFILVDLPGYGYAKISKKKIEQLHDLIFTYLKSRKQLKMLYLLIDSRHELKSNDLAMLKFLTTYKIPTSIVLTKIDKANKLEIEKNIIVFDEIKKSYSIIASIYKTSSNKKIGLEDLKNGISSYFFK